MNIIYEKWDEMRDSWLARSGHRQFLTPILNNAVRCKKRAVRLRIVWPAII